MPTDRPESDVRRPRRRWLLAIGAVVLALAVVVVVQRLPEPALGQDANPFLSEKLYADPGSKAAGAAAHAPADQQALLDRVARVPTGIWLTPEEWPVGRVGERVHDLVAAADDDGSVPLLVVYGIPGRDCSGEYSSGGLTTEAYVPWVREIATNTGGRAVVVLEPDALAMAQECDRVAERTSLLSQAVGVLVEHGATTYLDAGHSDWLPADQMADLLRAAGVGEARGFASNVAAYQADADERAYGAELSGLLGGVVHVIDTGRNGNGANSQWCNPPGRALGAEPSAVEDGTALDANLWIKPPGESDGACNGGPAAGQWWPAGLLELARNAGWQTRLEP